MTIRWNNRDDIIVGKLKSRNIDNLCYDLHILKRSAIVTVSNMVLGWKNDGFSIGDFC